MIQYFPIVTGSLVVLGNVSVSGSINASGSVTISGSIASASYALSASNAATASSADNFLTRGTLTAQTIVVQTITSSIDYVTGSTRFGSLSSDTHDFTGSVRISGSLTSTGSITTIAPTGNANLIIQTLQAAQNTQIQFVNTAKTVYIGNQIASAGSMFEVHDASLGASRLLISSSGNVGIGTTTPTTLLHVSGTTGGLLEIDGASAVNALYVSASGRVGIGTTGPLSLLDVNLLASGARRLFVNYDDSLVTIKSANNSSTAESLRVWGDNIYFYTGSAGSELMRLTNTGKVGIGTSSPEGVLTIQGTSAQPASSGTTANSLLQLVGSLNNQLNIGSNTVAGNYGSYIQASDNNLAVPYPLNLQPNGGAVGIGTSTPSGSRLHVFIGNDGGSGTPGVILATSNGVNDIVRFQDGTTTVAVVKNDGKIFINNSSGVSLNGLTNFLSVSSTTYNLFDISRFSDNAFGPNFYLVKSRNASIGGNTIVASGDNLGNIVWLGANGTGFTDAASIRAEVDGTPGASNDMPGRLVFTTTGDGSGTPTERMRINSSGNILMSATTAPTATSGNIMMFNNTIFFDYVAGIGSPYTSNLRVDIVWNNWGGNNVAALLDVDFLAREWANLGGVAFGRIYALSSGGGATFNSTINTTNVTTANATLTVSSPSNYMLRLLFSPTNNKDYIGCFIRIPINSAGTGPAVASITATLV